MTLQRLGNDLDFHAQALALRSQRQRLLASNIANADTPGFVARDLDFAAALRDATGGGGAVAAALRPLRASLASLPAVSEGVVVAYAPVGFADTLEDARYLIPLGRTRIDRSPEDDPVIVESWI